MIEYIHSAAMNSTMLTPMHGTECKGLGKILGLVVGVVAAIAVPFLAPVIGGVLGGGFFASIAGQALIGAGIGALGGAAGSALSGGDILKGALLGGAGGALTGGVGAWMSGAGLTTAAAPAAGAGAGAAGAPASIDPLTGFENANAAIPAAAGIDAGVGAAGALATPDAALSPALAGAATSAAAPATGIAGIVGSTGFKTAAIQTLLNGGTQMLQSLQPDQQADLFKQMQAEMEVTRTQDAAAYAAQKKIFDEYYNFAKGINPEFFSQLERANESQRLSSTWADTERTLRGRGYSPAAIAAERRKQEVEGAAGLNTASAGGLMKGLNAQGYAMQTAASLYPKSSPSTMANLDYLRRGAGEEADNRAKGIAGLVAPWQVYLQGRTEGSPNTHV